MSNVDSDHSLQLGRTMAEYGERLLEGENVQETNFWEQTLVGMLTSMPKEKLVNIVVSLIGYAVTTSGHKPKELVAWIDNRP